MFLLNALLFPCNVKVLNAYHIFYFISRHNLIGCIQLVYINVFKTFKISLFQRYNGKNLLKKEFYIVLKYKNNICSFKKTIL